MFGRLVRPFKKRYNKYTDKVNGFVNPVRDSVQNLLGHIPRSKAFAGTEASADGATNASANGLIARLKSFKKSLKEMSDFQKLILLTIAICLPAGILISSILVSLIRKQKK